MPETLKPTLMKALKQTDSPYIRHFLTIDVSKRLPYIKCPVLALNGTKDIQVDCTHTLKKIEGVNHLFQHCQTGVVSEYPLIEETIAPEVLEIVTKWIHTEI